MTFDNLLVDKILNAIFPLPKHFGMIIYDDEPDRPVYLNLLNESIHEIDKDAQIYYGMSKFVIISPNLKNIVIKIPFNGYFTCIPGDEEYDEEVYNWTSFCCAEGSDNKDYCLSEYEKFLNLKKEHLNCFVAKTLLYKVCNGIRIFIQEKVVPEEDTIESHYPSLESQKLAKQLKNTKGLNMDTEWIANCLEVYGTFKVNKFLDYCSNIDLSILDDMHSGNYGYRTNGTPVLIDYSNYLD